MLVAVGQFAFLGIHVKPDDAVAEIDKLYDVYESVSRMWGTTVKNISFCKLISSLKDIKLL